MGKDLAKTGHLSGKGDVNTQKTSLFFPDFFNFGKVCMFCIFRCFFCVSFCASFFEGPFCPPPPLSLVQMQQRRFPTGGRPGAAGGGQGDVGRARHRPRVVPPGLRLPARSPGVPAASPRPAAAAAVCPPRRRVGRDRGVPGMCDSRFRPPGVWFPHGCVQASLSRTP